MTYRTCENPTAYWLPAPAALHTILKAITFSAFAVIALATGALAAEPPDAPSNLIRMNAPVMKVAVPGGVPKPAEARLIDKKFVSLAVISTGSTFADSYTTLFARQNWLAHKQGVCNIEVQSPYLYGTHPTVGRAYAVASAKSAGSVFAAYYARKHHNRFWSLPLVANSIMSLEGVTQNMITCN
jgi:hypothetical protein